MENFKEIDIPQALFHRLEQIGFTTPTPIQAKAIPEALKGNDILGSAQTGTGKTAAYGIPLISKLLNSSRGTALILLPTRELAVQVDKSLQQMIGRSKINTAILIGGEDIQKQIRQLKANPRLIVGTPGRINDHLKRGTLKLHDTDFLVLDEVDRMLDMGFGIQLDEIAKWLTAKRQTLMFSATLPKNIEQISAKYLTDPIRVSVGTTHETAKNVKEENITLADTEKFTRLTDEFEKRQGSIIVFVKTKRSADNMAVKLRKNGHKADALHGDLRQNKRNNVINGFRKQTFRILVATDVAARGLDIPHIEHVFNFDLPTNPEDYIHRIGRTARAGAEGEAINFISPADNGKWKAIERLLKSGENSGSQYDRKKKSGKKPSFRNRSRNNQRADSNRLGNAERNSRDISENKAQNNERRSSDKTNQTERSESRKFKPARKKFGFKFGENRGQNSDNRKNKNNQNRNNQSRRKPAAA
ncbi:DEAD/DEAH box helicase [Rickettsiales bacterium]|nr:DEAD/DEAH box helicase [Rickettsiales bacterium]